MIKAIRSGNPHKKKIVNAFKKKYDASKITNVKFNPERNIFFANCFFYDEVKSYQFLGIKEINAIEVGVEIWKYQLTQTLLKRYKKNYKE